jgi:hypothetical protein
MIHISASNSAGSRVNHDFAESRPDQWRDVELKNIIIFLFVETQKQGKGYDENYILFYLHFSACNVTIGNSNIIVIP